MPQIQFMAKERELKFEKYLLPHVQALHTFAYHLVYDEEHARDLVQETFLRAYKALDSFKEGTNAKAWLFQILKNEYINQYRKNARAPKRVDYEDYIGHLEQEQHAINARSDMRKDIYQNLIGDEITIAINTLPFDLKTVVLLCDVEGFTYEEIAKIIDVPVGTIRSRLYRARVILREKLKPYAAKLGYKVFR